MREEMREEGREELKGLEYNPSGSLHDHPSYKIPYQLHCISPPLPLTLFSHSLHLSPYPLPHFPSPSLSISLSPVLLTCEPDTAASEASSLTNHLPSLLPGHMTGLERHIGRLHFTLQSREREGGGGGR